MCTARLATFATTACLAFGTAAMAGDRSPLSFDLGGGADLKFYGYVKGDYMWDRDYDLGDTTKGLRDIGKPAGPAAGKFEHGHFRETRFGFEVRRGDLFSRFEGDFFGKSDNFHMRHAFVQWKGLMVGQNWTNFMSLENLGTTVDFQQSAGIPFARVPQIRYTHDTGAALTVSGSVEEDISGSGNLAVTAAARYGFESGMVRASALVRDTQVGGADVDGWGVSLAGNASLWQGGTLKAMITTGAGISDWLAFGMGGTAVYAGGDEVGVTGFSMGVTQKVGTKVLLAATWGQTDLDRAAATDTKKLETLHLSAFYDPVKNLRLGVEYFTGTRRQGNGAEFDADRVQIAAKYSF